MIEEITQLTNINYSTLFLSVFMVLLGIKAMVSLLEWVIQRLGLETRWMRKQQKERELLKQTAEHLVSLKDQQIADRKLSNQHDKMIQSDLSRLSDTVNRIVTTLEQMQAKENETELKKLKDSLIRYYNKYKTIGEWSRLEKDAFWDLFDDYEKRGGDGYVHSIVEPAMRELREVD